MDDGRNGVARQADQPGRGLRPRGGSDPHAEAPREASEVAGSLARGFWLLVAGLVLGGAVALWILTLATPIYEAQAYALVSPRVPEKGEPERGLGNTTPGEYAQAYAELVTSPTVVGSATSPLGADPAELEGTLRAEASSSSPMLKVAASSPDPANAADLANAAAEAVASYTEKLSDETGYQARLVAEATPPAGTVWPKPLPTVVAGGAVGLALGTAAAMTWYRPGSSREAQADRPGQRRRSQ